MLYEKINRVLDVLKQGKLIILADSEQREAEGDFVGLATLATATSVNMMITYGRGILCAPLSEKIAKNLNLHEMTNNSSDPFRTAFTISVDYHTSTTGVSALERATTIRQLSNPNSKFNDFYTPGHVFPLIAKNGGVLIREGHTEAAVDLAILSGSYSVAFICEIMNQNGTMSRRKDLKQLATDLNMEFITIEELIKYRFIYDRSIINLISSVNLPTKYGDFNLKAYSYIGDNKEYIVLIKGDISGDKPTLVRLHSECLTGDVFASYRCDCKEQLEKSLIEIQNYQRGILIYLRQEGRGIGLFNKLKTYELQEKGLDTAEANAALGLPIDNRQYGPAAAILHNLKVTNVHLITNNPDKIKSLKQYNVNVSKVISINIPSRKENEKYLQAKKYKLNHMLDM